MNPISGFGISEFTTHPWSFERDVEGYASAGADAIEICEYKLHGDAAQMLDLVARSGLRVSSVQTTIHSFFPDSLQPEPADPGQRLARIEASLERISACLDRDAVPFVVITGAAPGGDVAGVLAFARRALEKLAGTAQRCGVRIAYEPLNPVLFNSDTALWSLRDGLDLVRAIDHPSLGLCVDTWNVFPTPRVAETIESCASRIFLVQISDYRTPRARADRVSLGDGSIDNAALIRAARRAGYRGDYVLEIFSDESLPDSLWRSDLQLVIETNARAFETLWAASEP